MIARMVRRVGSILLLAIFAQALREYLPSVFELADRVDRKRCVERAGSLRSNATVFTEILSILLGHDSAQFTPSQDEKSIASAFAESHKHAEEALVRFAYYSRRDLALAMPTNL